MAASGSYSDPVHNAASFAVDDIDNDGWLDLYATLAIGGNHPHVISVMVDLSKRQRDMGHRDLLYQIRRSSLTFRTAETRAFS